MQDFVSLFIDFNKEFESPESFWRWSAYGLVASTLRNNVYHNQGNDILYPNIYILLLADSAAFRKGGPFPLVAELVNELHHTKLYDGRASIQAILEKLSLDIGGKKGLPIKGGSCLLLAEELASFFVADLQLIPMITNIYRSRKIFTYDLRGNDFIVKDLCVTMLAASNETNLQDVFDKRAVYGGLLGRTFLIKPDQRRPENSLVDVNALLYERKPLVDSLEEIKKLSGQVIFTEEAKKIYKKWYKELYASLLKIQDPTGVQGRIHTGVLKLAMIIAASHYTLEINEEHIEIAINQCVTLGSNYEAYAMSSGNSSHAKVGSLFIKVLWENTNSNGSKLTRKEFLMNYWNQVSADDLDKLVATLEQGGMIVTDYTDNEIGYAMTQKCRDIFESKKKIKEIKANKATNKNGSNSDV